MLVAEVKADAFCHSMVRALVGACVAVGEGRLDVDDLVVLRDALTRTSEFKVLAARGLDPHRGRLPRRRAALVPCHSDPRPSRWSERLR